MSNIIVKTVIHSKFSLTRRKSASVQIEKLLKQYLRLTDKVDDTTGSHPVYVPNMIGIDEEMRNWSLFMILEHNTIVNRIMTDIVKKLANGKDPTPPHPFDPKKDVLPSGNPGREHVDAFRDSVKNHLQTVSLLPSLRGTSIKQHPLFGAFDAHKWHCMFGFHLGLHLKQADYVVKQALRHPS